MDRRRLLRVLTLLVIWTGSGAMGTAASLAHQRPLGCGYCVGLAVGLVAGMLYWYFRELQVAIARGLLPRALPRDDVAAVAIMALASAAPGATWLVLPVIAPHLYHVALPIGAWLVPMSLIVLYVLLTRTHVGRTIAGPGERCIRVSEPLWTLTTVATALAAAVLTVVARGAV